MADPLIRVLPNRDALIAAAAEHIAGIADESIRRRQAFSIALSGDTIYKPLYELLASDGWSHKIEFKSWEIYFTDERPVAPADAHSHFRLACDALLDCVPILPEHIHRMKGELDPEQAAREYGQLLKEKFADNSGPDMILLSMGDDGHTASLFPATSALNEMHHRCVANHVEALDESRITMSAPFINRSHHILILAAGSAIASRVAEVLEGPRDPQRLPIQLIEPSAGELLWLIDADAAGMNEE